MLSRSLLRYQESIRTEALAREKLSQITQLFTDSLNLTDTTLTISSISSFRCLRDPLSSGSIAIHVKQSLPERFYSTHSPSPSISEKTKGELELLLGTALGCVHIMSYAEQNSTE